MMLSFFNEGSLHQELGLSAVRLNILKVELAARSLLIMFMILQE